MGKLPTVKTQNIPDGFAGNQRTLKEMIKLAKLRMKHPLIRKLAEQIPVHYQVKSHDYRRECIVIGDYVKQRVRYVRDPLGVEYVKDPLLMIQEIMEYGESSGDCDDMSLLVATLLLAIGAEPFFKVVSYDPTSKNWHHIYVVVYEANYLQDKKWLSIDAIAKNHNIGYEVPHEFSETYRII